MNRHRLFFQHRVSPSLCVGILLLALLSSSLSTATTTVAFVSLSSATSSAPSSIILSAKTLPSPRPPPRRNLKKRPGRQGRDRRNSKMAPFTNGNNDATSVIEFPWEIAEVRPMIKAKSIEAGTDYWIDEEELAKSIERERAIKNRKAMESEISQEKLKTEIAAPYKQNWIGLLSTVVVVLAFIVKQFPELLVPPSIPFPDL